MQKKSIMVIEDNSDLRALQKILLEMAGYLVLEAGSGAEGQKHLAAGKNPDLILLDVELGDMTGSEFLDQIETANSEILKNVPVVYVTGHDRPSDQRAKGYIRKGQGNREFINQIKTFMD